MCHASSFHKHVWLFTEYMPTLYWRTGASAVSPWVITVSWWISSNKSPIQCLRIYLYWSCCVTTAIISITLATNYCYHCYRYRYCCHYYQNYQTTLLMMNIIQQVTDPMPTNLFILILLRYYCYHQYYTCYKLLLSLLPLPLLLSLLSKLPNYFATDHFAADN